MDPIAAAFAPVLGLPSWMVHKGHGSFVTVEFGEPQVEFSEPHLAPLFLYGAPKRAMRRSARVHGQWHLWVYCCDWSLRLDQLQLAHNESDDTIIARALSLPNGQALTDIEVQPTNGATVFTFDLGCTLTTSPAPDGVYGDSPVKQWHLYQPSGDVLTVRSDGSYSNRPGNTQPEDETWTPIPVR